MSGPDRAHFDEATLASLSDLLDGRLDAKASDQLRARLAAEPDLAAELDALEAVGSLLREDTARLPGAPADFAARVRSSIARVEASERAATPRLVRWMGAAYAAAALVIVGWTVGWFAQRGQPALPTTTATSKSAAGTATSTAAADRAPGRGHWEPPAAARMPAPAEAEGAPEPFLGPAGSVGRGQRTPTDAVRDLAAEGRGGANDGAPPEHVLVVTTGDVDAFLAWLALVRADEPARSLDAIGLVAAVYRPRDELGPVAGDVTTLRFQIDVATWRRLFGRLKLPAVAERPPPGESLLDVRVQPAAR